MPVLDFLTSSGFGSLLGMRHALEPDHLAAVTTLMTGERANRGPYRAMLLGVCWGLGHTASLVLVGAAVVALRATMPARITDIFELLVALMLVALGLRAVRAASYLGAAGPVHAHTHGALVHEHQGAEEHIHVGAWTLARRPLIVGAVHGLAGSGALTALVLATLPTTGARIAYIVLFGIGSTLGMAALTGLLGWPLARAGQRASVARGLSLTAGVASTLLGLVWGYPLVARFF